jgi:hypothetical protein
VAKKYHKEIADKIKLALDDEVKMQDLSRRIERKRLFQIRRHYRTIQIQFVELQGVSQRTPEKDSDYQWTGEDQQGAEKKNQSSWCLSKR